MGTDARQLRELIVRSRVFDPALKRAWLRVLPLMEPEHRRELAEILRAEAGPAPLGGHDSGHTRTYSATNDQASPGRS